MKLLILILVLSNTAFAQVRLKDKNFLNAVSECNGYLHPVEATDLESMQVLSCVEKNLKEKKQYDDLKETLLFWNPLETMKHNERRLKCRGFLGKKNHHGEDSGEYEACLKGYNCVHDRGIDHVGLSPAPCVSDNDLGVNQEKKVLSGDRTGSKDQKFETQESHKHGVSEQ